MKLFDTKDACQSLFLMEGWEVGRFDTFLFLFPSFICLFFLFIISLFTFLSQRGKQAHTRTHTTIHTKMSRADHHTGKKKTKQPLLYKSGGFSS